MRTMLPFWPFERLDHLRVALAVLRAEFAIERQVAAPEPGAHRDEGALDHTRLFRVRRRQVEAQDVAAAEQVAAVERAARRRGRRCARAGLGRRDQAPQHRRDALGIDREVDAVERVLGRAVALSPAAGRAICRGRW